MKKCAVILALVSIAFTSCQKEIADKLNQPNEIITLENQKLAAAITTAKTKTYLNGYVVNEQGQPVAGVNVLCGTKTVTTDNKGFFYFKEALTVNKDYALITVSKPGYRKGFRTFTPNRSKLTYHTEKIMLQADGVPQSVPVSGGTVTADGIKLTFPAYSVMKPGGYAYNGNVRVMIRYISPASSNFPLLVPGMLSGLNSNGEIKALQSFGMANVEITDAAGNKLEIAPGKTVKMEMPAPANGPATIPLWHFNETYGIWIQQGSANKVGNVYVAEVNHFSIWNIDLEFNDFELNLKFQTAAPSAPIANLRVDVYRPNNVFVHTFFTDNAGEGTLINCPSTEALTLKMVFACDTITYSLAPVTQSRTEVITLSGGTIQTYGLSGTLYACNNQPLANQSFQVFLTGPGNFITVNGISGAQGQFNLSTVLPSCQSIGNLSAQTTAYYNSQYYFSTITTVAPGTNIYNPTLCDTIPGGQPFNDSDVVNIPDPNLQQKVRQAINKPAGTIYYIDVKNLDYIDAASSSVQSIIGLQYFTGLDSLYLAANSISDLTPLQNLNNIQELVLEQNNISNITPLQTMTGLRWLYLGINQISNLSPLQNLTSLLSLGLDNNQISNLTPLQNLTGLKQLFLFTNQISNITALQNLTALEELELDGNQISNLTSLQNLTALKILYSSFNQITSISPLQNLTSLEELFLDSNQITSITPLQNLTLLKRVTLSSNQIANLTPLQNLNALLYLELRNNQLSTIQTLITGVPNLFYLGIMGGNTVPPAEITSFQASHPNCIVQ